ncbi:hypothetical protein B0H50_12835 [Hallerella porci]|uniref:Uncharacterized protein n=1 Tax=Hallerella porci TaxID=1945871 RepID=A0ABX5LP81_9BACT|nr:hypothetical protein B0H50_12835 [Hallerella porci]
MATNHTGNPNPNWPSRTGNPSGGGRGNNPPSK